MSSSHPAAESFFDRHAWKVFFGLSVIIALFGLGDALGGAATFAGGEAPTMVGIAGLTWEQLGTTDPGGARMIDYLVRAGGVHLFVLGLLSLIVSLTGFRQAQRWAWYAMWLWPVWLASVVFVLLAALKQAGPGIPPPLLSGSLFFLISVATLGLSYRRFFRSPSEHSASAAIPAG